MPPYLPPPRRNSHLYLQSPLQLQRRGTPTLSQIQLFVNVSALTGSYPPTFSLFADIGSTGHFLAMHATGVGNKHSTLSPIPVLLANHPATCATNVADLDVPYLPLAARVAHLFPSLSTSPCSQSANTATRAAQPILQQILSPSKATETLLPAR